MISLQRWMRCNIIASNHNLIGTRDDFITTLPLTSPKTSTILQLLADDQTYHYQDVR